ncbi:MAG TPA: ubiquitin-conjugating enzyme E2 [Ignavibacteria bacterium]|nr:ubiquitin-conjugating enzyme E2 [Ignavibacteria bacterium]HQY52627.1 ubiquitin-conjugating enzyme E2 [Ignavibacteria bacterium]HRB00413.1 ubiquitin-conjugating enzyme E2 [Ignavibacteria bacterium]
MSPRQRRLISDFRKMKEEFSNHPFISFEYDSEMLPPDRYVVTYRHVKGLKLAEASAERKELEIITEHQIEIYLHIDYPRLKPQSYIMTKIFHPNFRMASPNDICIGDYWASGETLVDIIYQIGEMITYKTYNVTSPLNGIAAKWAKENSEVFPIDNVNLRQGEVEIHFSEEKDQIDIN